MLSAWLWIGKKRVCGLVAMLTASHCVTEWTWNGLHEMQPCLTHFWFKPLHHLLTCFFSFFYPPSPPPPYPGLPLLYLPPVFLSLFLPLFLPFYRMGRAAPRIQSETLRPLTPLQDYYTVTTVLLHKILRSLLWSILQEELQYKLFHLLQKVPILLILQDYNTSHLHPLRPYRGSRHPRLHQDPQPKTAADQAAEPKPGQDRPEETSRTQ